MEDQPVIMVQVAEPEWTWDVLHAACKLARSCGGTVHLVHMVCAKHLCYLGTSWAISTSTISDKQLLKGYVDTIDDYGLACGLTVYQYCTMYEAITGAADQVAADVVFAKLPKSRIPFWSDCQFELLRVRLSRQHVELFNDPGIWNTVMPIREAGTDGSTGSFLPRIRHWRDLYGRHLPFIDSRPLCLVLGPGLPVRCSAGRVTWIRFMRSWGQSHWPCWSTWSWH